jgi:hypothetical protein
LHFEVASFFIESVFLAPCVLGLALFSLEVFFLSSFHFELPLFLSKVFLLSQRARGLIVRLRSWLRFFKLNSFC